MFGRVSIFCHMFDVTIVAQVDVNIMLMLCRWSIFCHMLDVSFVMKVNVNIVMQFGVSIVLYYLRHYLMACFGV